MRFGHVREKISAIAGVFADGEKIGTMEISRRLAKQGYDASPRHLGMFIRYNMLHEHLEMERRSDKSVAYFLSASFRKPNGRDRALEGNRPPKIPAGRRGLAPPEVLV